MSLNESQKSSRLDTSPYSLLLKEYSDSVEDYIAHARPTLADGRWLHFDELFRRWPKSLDTNLTWSLVKQVRAQEVSPLLKIGEPSKQASFKLTSIAQRAISATDQKTTHAQLAYMLEEIGDRAHLAFLVEGLTEDEAISSSQLEGAVTTTKVAKELLKSKSKGKTSGEKMIIGNMKMMNYIWENRAEELSLKFILELHEIGTAGIDDESYQPSIFRFTDDVIVEDQDQNTLHQPPSYEGLEGRLQNIVNWVNEKHRETFDNDYIHPLIKAICLHFVLVLNTPFTTEMAELLGHYFIGACSSMGLVVLGMCLLVIC